jgi:hypothetical protein
MIPNRLWSISSISKQGEMWTVMEELVTLPEKRALDLFQSLW